MGPIERGELINKLLLESKAQGDSKSKTLKLYIMPNLHKVKRLNRKGYRRHWNDALTTWKQLKQFSAANEHDEQFLTQHAF